MLLANAVFYVIISLNTAFFYITPQIKTPTPNVLKTRTKV